MQLLRKDPEPHSSNKPDALWQPSPVPLLSGSRHSLAGFPDGFNPARGLPESDCNFDLIDASLPPDFKPSCLFSKIMRKNFFSFLLSSKKTEHCFLYLLLLCRMKTSWTPCSFLRMWFKLAGCPPDVGPLTHTHTHKLQTRTHCSSDSTLCRGTLG